MKKHEKGKYYGSGTRSRSRDGLAEMGWLYIRLLYKPEPDQTQPGRLVWIQSGKPSGYDIGSVKERTKGCVVASPLLYNFWINQV